MKRLATLFLVLSLLLSGVSALAESAPLTTEPVTFKIAARRQVLDLSENFNDKLAAKLSEEATGIHIDWIELTDYQERVNLMLASGDLPDAFLSVLDEEPFMKNLAAFAPLNDLIDANAPHIKAQYDAMDGMWEKVTMTDGNIYSLMTGKYTNPDNWAEGIPVANYAWLEKLGLQVPTTLDEFYNVLVAIRDGDPNGNGVKDEIPLQFCQNDWCTHIIEYGGSWGFNDYYKVQDGQYIFMPGQAEFKEFLQFYHKLAKEGLLDVEGFSQTAQQFFTKVKEDKAFMFFTWTASGLVAEEKAKEFQVIIPPAAEGYKSSINGEINAFKGNRYGFAITTACKDPGLLLKWFDHQNKDLETKMQWRFGEQGLLWDFAEDGSVKMMYPEATAQMSVENMKYTYGNMDFLPALIFPDELEKPDGEKYPSTVVREKMVEECMDYLPTVKLPIRPVPAEKVNERTLIWTDLKAYVDSFIATSIVEGLTDAQWDEHLTMLEAYGANEYTQWYQDFIDGKF